MTGGALDKVRTRGGGEHPDGTPVAHGGACRAPRRPVRLEAGRLHGVLGMNGEGRGWGSWRQPGSAAPETMGR